MSGEGYSKKMNEKKKIDKKINVSWMKNKLSHNSGEFFAFLFGCSFFLIFRFSKLTVTTSLFLFASETFVSFHYLNTTLMSVRLKTSFVIIFRYISEFHPYPQALYRSKTFLTYNSDECQTLSFSSYYVYLYFQFFLPP